MNVKGLKKIIRSVNIIQNTEKMIILKIENKTELHTNQCWLKEIKRVF